MKPEKVVLCASSKYEQKFYLNEEFKGLPEEIKKELKIMCVLFTEDGEARFKWLEEKITFMYR